MSKDLYHDHLADIVEAGRNALSFVEGMAYDEFVADIRTSYAMVRALEIIGEATRRLPMEIREQHPQIPWRQMAGMRDRLIHAYDKVDPEIVWATATQDLPRLVEEVQKILEYPPDVPRLSS